MKPPGASDADWRCSCAPLSVVRRSTSSPRMNPASTLVPYLLLAGLRIIQYTSGRSAKSLETCCQTKTLANRIPNPLNAVAARDENFPSWIDLSRCVLIPIKITILGLSSFEAKGDPIAVKGHTLDHTESLPPSLDDGGRVHSSSTLPRSREAFGEALPTLSRQRL